MVRYVSIKDYIQDLKRELKGIDEAIISDAMDDAEEHLSVMVEEILDSGRAKSKEKAVALAARDYGSPKEVAKAYVKLDEKVREKTKVIKETKERRSFLAEIFGIYRDPRTYTGLLYLLLMFPIGIIYFTYLVTMISVSLSLIIFVFGIFIAALFLVSNYGLAWVHGRFTEFMLGIRMPKKQRKLRVKGTIWQRLKALFKDPRMYSSLLYMFLMFPLGIIYFTIFITFLALSISLVLLPIPSLLGTITGLPMGLPVPVKARLVLIPLGFLLGFVMLTWTLHLSNIICHYHGKMTKALLVKR
ncbi:MAG: sensor domain-containing protein [Thermoplasmatota archaeon]